jgi:hypothetical protein
VWRGVGFMPGVELRAFGWYPWNRLRCRVRKPESLVTISLGALDVFPGAVIGVSDAKSWERRDELSALVSLEVRELKTPVWATEIQTLVHSG